MSDHELAEYNSVRETAEVLADPGTLRALAAAQQSIRTGDVVYGVAAARALLDERTKRVGEGE